MSCKEKVVIYPYDMEFAPILRNKTLQDRYEIVGVVAPGGWGAKNMDAGRTDGGDDIGIIVTNDFSASLTGCDTVIFSNTIHNIDIDKFIITRMKEAAEYGKNVINTINIDEAMFDEIAQKCKDNNKSFVNYSMKNNEYYLGNEQILEIRTPVIFVLGISERTNKFHIQLALRKKMLSMGYNISQVGSRPYCNLFGFHSFPSFMFSKNLNEASKIVAFNRFIKQIEKIEKPDVIIIGIPGGIFKINNSFTNGFGIIAYEVSQAVIPDAVVFSTFYENYDKEFFEKLNNNAKYKLGYAVDCYNLSNTQFDWMAANEYDSVSYLKIDNKKVDEKIKKSYSGDIPVYNTLNANNCEMMIDFLVDRLSGNDEVDLLLGGY